jgi:hypothetical protein
MSDAENTSSSDSESGTVIVPNRCDIATGSSSAVGAPVVARRKWTDEADILLLKEVAARKAHIPVFGKAMETYSAIAEALTGKIPWETDAKHCRDRYTLLTRTFKRRDRIGRSSTGIEEEFDERERLLTGLIEEADLWKDKRAQDKSHEHERNQRLKAAGSEARALALARCGGAYVSTATESPQVPVRAVRVLEQAASSRTPSGSGGSADIDDCEVEDEPRANDDQGEVRAGRRKRKFEQEIPTQREEIYGKLFKIEADNAARAEKQFELDSRRLSLERERIAADREERLLDRQAQADERRIDRETQKQQSEGLNQVLTNMSQSQKAIQEGFLSILNRVLEKK